MKKKKVRNFQIFLPENQHQLLGHLKVDTGKTIGELIAEAIDEFLERKSGRDRTRQSNDKNTSGQKPDSI